MAKRASRVVMGVDVSERAMGLVAVPWDWELNWSKVARHTCGVELHNTATARDHCQRIVTQAQTALVFARRYGVTDVWMEGYSFSGGGKLNHRSVKLETEVSGAIKVVMLNKLGIACEEAPLSSARKMVLGKLPRADTKAITHATVRSFSAMIDGWTGDEIDAWIAANYGLGQIGGTVSCHPLYAG